MCYTCIHRYNIHKFASSSIRLAFYLGYTSKRVNKQLLYTAITWQSETKQKMTSVPDILCALLLIIGIFHHFKMVNNLDTIQTDFKCKFVFTSIISSASSDKSRVSVYLRPGSA